MLHLHFLLFRQAPATRLCDKALWVFVLLVFCIFDCACSTREKAEGKMLVNLKYMHMKVMFCIPRSAQTALAGWWSIHLCFSNRKRKGNSETSLVAETHFCYRLLVAQTSCLKSPLQIKPLIKLIPDFFSSQKSHCNDQDGCYMQVI